MGLSESVAKFLVGGLCGYALERKVNPSLKGLLPGVPFRPVYGFGAALATNDFATNTLVSMCAEELGNEKNLWQYDTNEPLAIDKNVRADYAIAFGSAMTLFSGIWTALSSSDVEKTTKTKTGP